MKKLKIRLEGLFGLLISPILIMMIILSKRKIKISDFFKSIFWALRGLE